MYTQYLIERLFYSKNHANYISDATKSHKSAELDLISVLPLKKSNYFYLGLKFQNVPMMTSGNDGPEPSLSIQNQDENKRLYAK